ncbi:dehydrogenase [Asanoa ishikariensis]|uniref:2-hydroxyacid dehydrogenase n=1 Tax=Asanoa ishikariensis TaxID=137265 RepID=UPI000B83D137|nr:2-hydroxyacid dehydrogenase [Asanoa ishikariensis]GIF67237.1 dehydrogenase [Asanoa ishikariensis]
MKVWIPHPHGRDLMGAVPASVTLEIAERPDALPSDPADLVFWVPPFLALSDSVRLAAQMPSLRVVQLLSAGADAWSGHLPPEVSLHDARGVHDSSTAEWVLTAILSYLREFPGFARAQARHDWSYAAYAPTDELAGKHVLIVGAGSIGTAIKSRLEPFEVTVTSVARTARDGVHPVSSLPSLLPAADVVVVIVPLTPETRGLVSTDFLAAMKDGALLVNAARGPVADTDALVDAVSTGRIGAAVDVTEPEPLPAGHPLWDLPNVLITPHVAGSVRGLHPRAYRLIGEQLRRFVAGEPLVNEVVGGY